MRTVPEYLDLWRALEQLRGVRTATGRLDKEQRGDIAGPKSMAGPELYQDELCFVAAAITIEHGRALGCDDRLCRVVTMLMVRAHGAGPGRPTRPELQPSGSANGYGSSSSLTI